MGRPKAFDEDAVLDRAAELFWTQGYEATSISDLEERLGVGRQSLYDTFGDKRRLFLRAIERYTEWIGTGSWEGCWLPMPEWTPSGTTSGRSRLA